MKIYPSILENSARELFTYINSILDIFDHYQIDIADGKFVKNITLQISDIADFAEKNEFISPEETFEFHLMVENPEEHIKKLAQLDGHMYINRVLVHLQPLTSSYSELKNSFPYEFGISINPEVSVGENWDTLKEFPIIQLMTVHPGAQGTPFVPEVLQKITDLRQRGYEGQILLDGAMNDVTLQTVLENEHLPDAICPGSYLKENTEEHLEKLVTLLKLRSLHG